MKSVTAALGSKLRLLTGVGLLAIAAMSMGGCGTASLGGHGGDGLVTGSTGEASLKETAIAGKRWQADPGDVKAGLRYASMLKSLDQNDRALEVLADLTRRHPENSGLIAHYGKELAEAGRGKEAADVLGRLVAEGKADWKVHSALGSALDQQGRHGEARQAYEAALRQRPDEIAIHNNLGMSFALEGNLKEAETTLRRAAALPDAGRQPRLRQNLALIVGLQGRFDEAREIASRDLPPDQIEANLTYLRSMLAQPNTWQQLKPAAPAEAGSG
jgi:Flp pilus assembly protein TadD